MPLLNDASTELQHAGPTFRGPSIMRKFLEEPTSFRWPSDSRRDGLCYRFNADYHVGKLLLWERALTPFRAASLSASTSSIDQWQVIKSEQDKLQFRECFAVKKLNPKPGSIGLSNNEVDAMTDLRFPHVAALLGTYIENNKLHILTFPAGCCDLGDLLDCMSLHLNGKKWVRPTDLLECYAWPLEESFEGQQARLKSYYVCLCEALAYLHNSHIRHKDIKPENIIIDLSGRVILVDFGISTKFRTKDPSLSTQNPITPSTLRYRPPEMQDGDARDQRSDVWSLGCVFLEMSSLILGEDMATCKQVCSHWEGKEDITDFCANPEGVQKWLDKLDSNARSLPRHSTEMKAIISKIREMLQIKKEKRPFADGVWSAFDFADIPQCTDCHPKNRNRWQPTKEQQLKNEAGGEKRQKMQAQESIKKLEDQLEAQRAINRDLSVRANDHTSRTRSRSPPVQDEERVPNVGRTLKDHEDLTQRNTNQAGNAVQIIGRTEKTDSKSSRVPGQPVAFASLNEPPLPERPPQKSRALSQPSNSLGWPSSPRRYSDDASTVEPDAARHHPSITTSNRSRGILTSRPQDQIPTSSSPPSPTPSNRSSFHMTKALRFQGLGDNIFERDGEDGTGPSYHGGETTGLTADPLANGINHAVQEGQPELPQSPKTPHIVEPTSAPDENPPGKHPKAQPLADTDAIPTKIDRSRLSPDRGYRVVSPEADRGVVREVEGLPMIETVVEKESSVLSSPGAHQQRPRTPLKLPCPVPDKAKIAACNCIDIKGGLIEMEYKALKGMEYVCFNIPRVDRFDVHSRSGYQATLDTSFRGGMWDMFRRLLVPNTARTIYMYNYDKDCRPMKLMLIDGTQRETIYPVTV